MDELLLRLYNPPLPKIVIGAWYTVQIREERSGLVRQYRIRAVKKYRHVILFETEIGVMECWTIWELARVIV